MEFEVGEEVRITYFILTICVACNEGDVFPRDFCGQHRELHLDEGLGEPGVFVGHCSGKRRGCLAAIHNLKVGDVREPQAIRVGTDFGRRSRCSVSV